jgi:DNA mismatch repair protein MutS2
MRKELLKFVLENELSPFSQGKISVARKSVPPGKGVATASLSGKKDISIYKTKDARKIHLSVLSKLSRSFVFLNSSNLWNCFRVGSDLDEIKRRQDFFGGLEKKDGSFLKSLVKPRASWKPRYDVVVVTEDEATFVKLNELSCGVILLTNQNDVADLERYDVVQVVDCDDFRGMLERLPQSVFLDSVEDVYLERFLEELSAWRENFAIMNGAQVSSEIRECLDMLIESFALLENKEGKIITEGEVESALEDINEEVGESIKGMMISGEVLMKMLGEGKMSDEVLEILRGAIEKSGVSEHVFNLGIPVTIDYKELEAQIKIQSANEFSDVAERIKRNASKLKGIPEILKRLEGEILVEDFCNGIIEYINGDITIPESGKNLLLEDGLNLFLREAQPISFVLNNEARCSILTGANSGGKTTLLEHVLQNVSLFRMGLPVVAGKFVCPIFDEVYYFAKTKGSTSKGAFETLLTQMAGIKSGSNALILADEIEAVTEPGVAGKIIGATAEYFVRKGCFIILATHLGVEISKNLPKGARVDGIEASGLDENFNLIVNHNPVLGRLASSTPELIVERMANSIGGEYFRYLFERVKKN